MVEARRSAPGGVAITELAGKIMAERKCTFSEALGIVRLGYPEAWEIYVAGDQDRHDDPVREGETPATAVDRTIRKFMADGEAKDYTEGKELVKSRHPQLWERYIRQA